MIKAHVFLDGKMRAKARLDHCYRVGDTVRLEDPDTPQLVYAKVTEVIWCSDEYSVEGQRVNIRLESEEICHD